MKQTAVEWLINEYFGGIENCTPDFRFHIQQAKEMEKEQIGKAFFEGILKEIGSGVLFDMQPLIDNYNNYYNETFKQQEQ